MSFLTDNSREPEYSETELRNTYIPVQGRKPRYTNERSTTGLPNFGMSPWNMVTSALTLLGVTANLLPAVTWGRYLVVSDTTGDDSTGTRNDIAKPYKTITAAMLAAQSLDTVFVLPGNYTENGTIIKPNVSLKCEAGAQITVTNFNANTLLFGGRHGVYGKGVFTFMTDTIQTINLSVTSGADVVFEADTLITNKVSLLWTAYKSLNYSVRTTYTAESSAFGINRSAVDSTCVAKLQDIRDSNDPSWVLYVNGLKGSSTVDIVVGNAVINRMNEINGFLYTTSNPATSSIKVSGNVTYANPTTFNESKAPIVTDVGCEARKDYNFVVNTPGYLYRPVALSAGVSETGTMKFSGTVYTYTAGQKLDSFINFEKELQKIVFDLDIQDDTTETLGGIAAILNVASASGLQKVSGKIYTERDVVSCPGVIVYGNYVYGTAAASCATLDNLTIVATGLAPCVRFHGGTPDIPCKNVYSNAPKSADNGGVTVVVDADITIDSNVR